MFNRQFWIEQWENFKNLFKPKDIALNIYKIDFTKLRQRVIDTLIIDVDDTLIPKTVNDIYPRVLEWVVDRKSEGFKIGLISNSRHPLRVKYIGESLKLPAIALGFKPFPFAFSKILNLLNSKHEKSVVIGDQLFMDILGGNLLNLHTIYVKPLTEETFWARKW